MTKNLMVLVAGAALTLVGCSKDDSGSDTGADGTDGTSADGADGTGFTPSAVTGLHQVDFDGAVAAWDVSGTTQECADCLFEFSGDFAVQSDSAFGEDFSATVTWTTDYYVYGFNGDYWGYGSGDGSGYAYWSGYSTNGNYYYAGYVYY